MKKHLTDEAVKATKLPSGRREIEIRDTECPGLVLRVGKEARTWFFYQRTGNKLVKLQLGPAGTVPGAMRLAAARKTAREMRDRVLAGADPRAMADDAPDTFEDLAKLFIDKYAKANRRTWADDEMLLRVHVTPVIGRRRLPTLDGPTFARLHESIRATGANKDAEIAKRLGRQPRSHAGGRIADRVLGLIKSILRWATPLGYMMGDLTVGIRKAGTRGGRKRALEDGEIAAFFQTIPHIYADERLQIAAHLTLLLGTRKMEVLAMRRAELHFDATEPYWQLPGGDVRDGGGKEHEHRLPLLPEHVALVRRAMSLASPQSDLVFESPITRRQFADTALNKPLALAFKTYRKRFRDPLTGRLQSVDRPPLLVCPPFNVHDIRRTVGTGMARIGIDRLHISKTLGHKTADHTGTTGIIYDRHSYFPEKRDALARWAAHVGRLHQRALQSDGVDADCDPESRARVREPSPILGDGQIGQASNAPEIPRRV